MISDIYIKKSPSAFIKDIVESLSTINKSNIKKQMIGIRHAEKCMKF